MFLTFKCQVETCRRVTASLFLCFTDKTRIHLLNLIVFTVSGLIQVINGHSYSSRNTQMTDPMYSFSPSRFQKQLGNFWMSFLHGLHRKGRIFQASFCLTSYSGL